jgi:uncharacterized membrane protein
VDSIKVEQVVHHLVAHAPVNALLFVAFWIYVIAAYGTLPDQIPHHMGADGQVNRWGGRGIWFLMPIMMSTHLVLVFGIASSITTASGINVPHKKRLLALPREAQQFALEPVRAFMYLMVTWMLVLSATIQFAMQRAGIQGRGSPWLLWSILALTVICLAGVPVLSAAVRKRIEAVESVMNAAVRPD